MWNSTYNYAYTKLHNVCIRIHLQICMQQFAAVARILKTSHLAMEAAVRREAEVPPRLPGFASVCR